MDSQTAKERTGRLYLWSSALSECQALLQLARRAEHSANILAELAAERAAKGLPPKSGRVGMTEFGGYPDLKTTERSCRMLAVVVFCQLVVSGNKASDQAAQNSKAFVQDELEACVRQVFTADTEKSQFDALISQLRVARDKMIAHADAGSFAVVHGKSMSSVSMISAALQGIDFGFWESILGRLNQAVLTEASRT